MSNLPDGACRELAGHDALFEQEGEYAVRINDEFTIDIMPSACGHRFAELEPFIEERSLDGVRLPVLGLAGLSELIEPKFALLAFAGVLLASIVAAARALLAAGMY